MQLDNLLAGQRACRRRLINARARARQPLACLSNKVIVVVVVVVGCAQEQNFEQQQPKMDQFALNNRKRHDNNNNAWLRKQSAGQTRESCARGESSSCAKANVFAWKKVHARSLGCLLAGSLV